MSPEELRYITIGDIHLSYTDQTTIDKLTRAIYVANQSNADFVAFVGDLVDASLSDASWQIVQSKLATLTKTYFVAAGNHDVGSSSCISPCPTGTNVECNFHTYLGVWPDQVYISTKGAKTFNIVIPGTCGPSSTSAWYLNFNRVIDKTLPTILFAHGPVSNPPAVPGTYNGYMMSNPSDIRAQLGTLSVPNTIFTHLLACYGGHIHAATYNVINGVVYVTEDNLSGNGPMTNYIGYTRIRDDYTVDYVPIRYQNDDGAQASFVDPFPSVCPDLAISMTI